MKNSDLRLLILFLIFLFGFILRFFSLSLIPPSLNWDEVSLGYNAYSLLHTGRDEWGTAFPLIFRAYGDYKLPGYIYADVVPVSILGLTPLAVRLPSVLSGTLLILVSYVLAFRLFRRSGPALIAALLVSVEPWNLFLSRVAVEANFCLLLIAVGMALMLNRKFLLSWIFFGISVWTYNSARVFVPLFLVFSFLLFRKRLQISLSSIFILVALMIPMFIQLISPSGQARFNWVNLLDSGAVARIESQRSQSRLLQPFPRLIHNRPVFFLSEFAKNYVSYFSPRFLFVSGGNQYQFNIPGVGLLSLVNFPLFIIGLVVLLASSRFSSRFVLLWLSLAPVAGSITRDSPHALRSLVMYPAVILVIITGYIWLFSRLKWARLLYFIVLLLSFGYYSLIRVPGYIHTFSWSWQYGYRQAIAYVKNHYSDYDQVIFTKKYGEPHEFVLFYWPWPSAAYQSDSHLSRYFRSDWYWVDSFAKFKFINDWEMSSYVHGLPSGKKYLIVSAPSDSFPGHLLTQINFLDGQPAFIIKSI